MRRVRSVFASGLAVLACAAIIAFGAPGPVMAEGEKDAATEATPVVAQSEVAKTPYEGLTKQAVNERIAEIQGEIDSIVSEKDVMFEEHLVDEEDIRRALVALGSLQNVYSRYLTVLDRLEETDNDTPSSVEKIETTAVAKPRFNLSQYEDMLNRFETAAHKLDSTTSSIRLSESNLASLKEQEQKLAERYQALLKEPEPPEGAKRLKRSLLLTEADADLESVQVSREAQKISIEAQKIVQSRAQAERDELIRELSHVKEFLVFDEKDRDERLLGLNDRLSQTREKLPALREDREKARQSLTRRQGALTTARSDKERQLAQAGVAEQQAALQLAQTTLEQAEQEVQFLEEE
ncbi:MAG: hypothetical protein WCY56_06555 [Aminobacteriaceae bacterium]